MASFEYDRRGMLVLPRNRPADAALHTIWQGGGPDDLPPGDPLQIILQNTRDEKVLRQFLKELNRDGIDHVPWNAPTLIHEKRVMLPSNSCIITGRALESLEKELILKLFQLYRKWENRPPIALIDYFDSSDANGCITTNMLRGVLVEILGEKGYETLVQDNGLRANFRITKRSERRDRPNQDSPIANNPGRYLRNVKEAIGKNGDTPAQGAIVIAGGTFSDADSHEGVWFRDKVMKMLAQEENVYSLMVCWSYQVMARALSELFDLSLYVLPGTLKFGISPVKFLSNHPALKRMFMRHNRSNEVSAVTTHGDHVITRAQLSGNRNRLGQHLVSGGNQRNGLRIIAQDQLNAQPYGFCTDDGRCLAIAMHPEARMLPKSQRTESDDIRAAQNFARGGIMRQLLQNVYGVPDDVITENFVPRDEKGALLIEQDIGRAFYTSVLLYFADQLLRD